MDLRAEFQRLPEHLRDLLDDLTDRQKWFCIFYTIGDAETIGNGTKSAERAGYSKQSAAQQASFLLTLPKIQTVLRALTEFKQEHSLVSFQHYIQMLLQQANSWLDDTGRPKEQPIVSQGTIVMGDFVVRDEEGKVVMNPNKPDEPLTVQQPIIEQWRPNASNTRALELIGKALGYLNEAPDDNKKKGIKGAVAPIRGYDPKQIPATTLDSFLDSLPPPDGEVQDAQVVSE